MYFRTRNVRMITTHDRCRGWGVATAMPGHGIFSRTLCHLKSVSVNKKHPDVHVLKYPSFFFFT